MDNLKQMITSIDLDSLLKLFDLQIALAVLIFFILFRKIFSSIIIKIYYKIIKRKKNPKESSMYKPLNIFFVLLGLFLTINTLPLSAQFLVIMNDIFQVIVLYYTTKAITTIITEDSRLFKKVFKRSDNKAVDKFICKIIRVIIWIIFVIISLRVVGFTFNGMGALITGLGIGSAAVALAAQDMVKSLLSGFTILTDKPFVVGDWIEVSTYQGTVIDITFRSTRIKSYDNTVITIPNSTITSTYVINWNRLTSRRFDCTLHLGLDTPSEKIRKFIREIRLVLENNPMVIKETVQVSLHEITMASCEIKIFLYVREADYNRFLDIKEELLCSMLFVAEKENIELASPRQNVYLRGKEEDKE